jgi:hypothetical protein
VATVASDVAAERGEDGGDVGEDQVDEAKAGEPGSGQITPRAEHHGTGARSGGERDE